MTEVMFLFVDKAIIKKDAIISEIRVFENFE